MQLNPFTTEQQLADEQKLKRESEQIIARQNEERLRSLDSRYQPRNNAKALSERNGKIIVARNQLIASIVAKHGSCPDAWTDEDLDAIAVLDARLRALDDIESYTKRHDTDWHARAAPKP